MTPSNVEVIAHRGFSARAPENTLAALEAAFSAGADAVEFDIHTAACGTPVLFHDTMLSRTTNGVGPIKRRTLAQLKKLDAGAWFSPEFVGEPVPSLEEAFAACSGRFDTIYAEVKGFREFEDLDRMIRIARSVGVLEQTVFIAMNWTLLDRMRSQQSDLRIGYIVEEPSRVDDALRRAHGDERALVDLDGRILLDDPVQSARFRVASIPMAVWTIDDPVQASRLLEMGVPRITTNQVDTLLAWKAEL